MRSFKPPQALKMWALGALVTLTLGLSAPSIADNPSAQQALLKAQGLLKQLAQQKTLLEVDLAKARTETVAKDQAVNALHADLKDKQQEIVAAQAGLAGATQKNTNLESDLKRTQERLAKAEQTLREVVAKYKDKATILRTTESAKAALETTLSKSAAELKDAEQKNLALYQLNQQILARYDQKSTWDVLLQKEPLTGIKRVEIETLLQEYSDKSADQLREINVRALEDGPTAQNP